MDSVAEFSQGATVQLPQLTLMAGLLIVVAIFFFGLYLWDIRYRRRLEPRIIHLIEHELHYLIEKGGRYSIDYVNAITAGFGEYLSRRNEYWRSFTQVIVAVFLLTAITVLLLTKTINPDAGLPILSGIAGFAIAKGADAVKADFPKPFKREE